MNPGDQRELIKDLLAEGGAEDFRRRSLESGLAELRHRRSRRRAGVGGGLFLAVLAAAVALNQRPQEVLEATRPHSTSPAPVKAATKEMKVKYITDEELFDLFPGRSVALIGKPGRQQLVFLDAKPTPSPAGL